MRWRSGGTAAGSSGLRMGVTGVPAMGGAQRARAGNSSLRRPANGGKAEPRVRVRLAARPAGAVKSAGFPGLVPDRRAPRSIARRRRPAARPRSHSRVGPDECSDESPAPDAPRRRPAGLFAASTAAWAAPRDRTGALAAEPDPGRHRDLAERLPRAHDHAVDLRGDRHRGVRRDGLRDVQVPPVQGRGAGHQVHPQHRARSDLDGHPDRDPGRLGDPGHAHGRRPVQRRPRRRAGRDDHQGHRLPVDVALRVRRPGRELHQPPGPRVRPHPPGRRHCRTPKPTRRTTCATSTARWCCRPTPASAS